MKQALIGVAAMLVLAAAHANAIEAPKVHRNTGSPQVVFAAIGSSAFFLEAGQGAYTQQGCAWTNSLKTLIEASDSRVAGTATNGGTLESASVWVAWNPGSGTCAAPSNDNSVSIYIYLNTDSVIGNRCFFATPRCTLQVNAAATTTSGSNLLKPYPTTDTTLLPSTIATALSGAAINVAATDIRPEDGRFAAMRALTPCGTQIGSTQYYGLGYQTGTAGVGTSILENSVAGSGSFHVYDFNLVGTDPISGNTVPGEYHVTSVGAVPIVVLLNPGDASGFGSLSATNLTRGQLASYLDGTSGSTSDIVAQAYDSGAGAAVTAFVREPLSGTYNTMEYAIPNSVEIQSSQDVGLASVNAHAVSRSVPLFNCTSVGGTVSQNPLNESNSSRNSTSGTSHRYRAIGTGDEIAAVLANHDSIGYGFWSAANFKNCTAIKCKYVTVDGIDPILQTWIDGQVPVAANGLLQDVTMAHVADGSYPIWSVLRMVSDNSGVTPVSGINGYAAVQSLVSSLGEFIGPSQPDFIPATALNIVRSHFAPPTISFQNSSVAANGTGSSAENGGDVGGVVYTIQGDTSYVNDTGLQTGNTGHRQ